MTDYLKLSEQFHNQFHKSPIRIHRRSGDIISPVPSKLHLRYAYDGEADALIIHFVKVVEPGTIEETASVDEGVNETIHFDLDKEDRIVAIEILNASKHLTCHFFDSPLTLEGKNALSLFFVHNRANDPSGDVLAIFFSVNAEVTSTKPIYDGVLAGLDAAGHYIALFIPNPAKIIRNFAA